jgi:hypothetical protein
VPTGQKWCQIALETKVSCNNEKAQHALIRDPVFLFSVGGCVGEFTCYAYKLKRWALWKHTGETMQNFIDRHTIA